MSSPPPHFEPIEFLNLARRLSRSTNEAELRSAISRAYYSVFLHAREELVATSAMNATGTGADHALVVRTLRSQNRPEGYVFRRLRVARVQADYDLRAPVDSTHAESMVRLTEAIWERLDRQ
jgi:uncharacterized protein (UPF0332 family)